MTTDITNVNWWADTVLGLLSPGEWKAIIFGLILTFAATYTQKILYFSFINESKQRPEIHIRLMAIVSGFIAAFAVWPNGAISMTWYIAGIMLGPLSIALHHILLGAAANPPLKNLVPWLYPLLKGKERRKLQVTMSLDDDRRHK